MAKSCLTVHNFNQQCSGQYKYQSRLGERGGCYRPVKRRNDENLDQLSRGNCDPCLSLIHPRQRRRGAAAEDSIHGRVTMLRVHRENQDLLDLVVNTGTKQEPHEITFVVNGTMPITLDGHAGKASDLAAGQTVTVTPASGKPTKIEAESHKRKPK